MTHIAFFSVEVVKEVFRSNGIYLLKDFADGQLIFGNGPIESPEKGSYFTIDECAPGNFDIMTIRRVLGYLAPNHNWEQVEASLFTTAARINDKE